MKFDIIIIGAGLGGLTAGAKLSREGKKVLLIEQHDRPGGCATTFRRRDFTMEVGLHELHGPSPTELKTKLFNELEVFNRVEFVRIPSFYRFVNGRYDYVMPHDALKAMEGLTRLFPAEAEGIKTYFDQLLKPRKKGSEPVPPDQSVGEYLDTILSDNDLKLILLGNLGYYHDDPYSLSLAYYSQAQGSYFAGGASFIKGGSQKLSDYLAGYIRDHGGEVLLNTLVTGIRVSNNRITGVDFRRKNDPDSATTGAEADELIAGNAMPNVAELLPGDPGLLLKRKLQDKATGSSLLTVYFGFNRPLGELGHTHYSTFVFDESVVSPADMLQNNHGDYSRRIYTFIDYSQVDSGLAPGGKGVGALCCMDYLADWEGLDQVAYKTRKEQVAAVFTKRLEKLIPGITGAIEFAEVATPATIQRYTLNPGGVAYGFAQTPSGHPVDFSGLPDNLHFASAWGRTGGGFSGAIYGGYLCALNIMRKR